MTTKAQSLAALCTSAQVKVVLAESCTGGQVAAAITSLAGCSSWFVGGVVSYSTLLKEQLLQVPAGLLQEFGAVSEPVALAMAQGVLQLASEADYAAAITGIAGPGGGSQAKPVGTVCFAVASKAVQQSFTQFFVGSREEVQAQAVDFILQAMQQFINKNQVNNG